MILVKKAPAGYIAQLYAEETLKFDLEMEQNFNLRKVKPHPPHIHYGPGGARLKKTTFLDATGEWKPTISEALTSLKSKKMIKSMEARIDRAKRKLAYEEQRLTTIMALCNIYDEDTGVPLIAVDGEP